MSTLPLSGGKSHFPAFQLKCPAFFGIFHIDRDMYLVVSFRVFCLFGIKSCVYTGADLQISRFILARAKSVYCLHDVLQYQLRTLSVKKLDGSRAGVLLSFFGGVVPLFHSLMLTSMGTKHLE